MVDVSDLPETGGADILVCPIPPVPPSRFALPGGTGKRSGLPVVSPQPSPQPAN